MSHLTRRRFSRRKAIHNDHPRTRKAQEEDCHGGNRQRHLRSAAPTRAVRTFPLSSTCSLMSQRCVPTATPRHATPRRPAVRRGPTPIAAWDTATASEHCGTTRRVGTGLYEPLCGTMRFLGASKRPLHPPGAASQSTECIEADWLGTRRSSSPLTQKRDHGIHACEVPATRRTEDLIELTSQLESGKAIEAVKTEQIQNN